MNKDRNVSSKTSSFSTFENPKQELRLVLTRLFDIIYPFGIIFGGIALIVSVLRSLYHGWYGTLFLHLCVYLFAMVLLAFRRRISVVLMFSALLGLISLDVVQCLFTMGLVSGAITNLAFVCIFAGIFLGIRAGIVAVSAGVLVVSLAGAGICAGMINMRPYIAAHLVEPFTWIIHIACFVTYVVPLIITVDGMKKRMMQGVHELKEANKTLQAEISMRELTEKELKKSEEKYRSIYENALEGIFQTTPDGCFVSANPALASIHGYISPDDLMSTITNLGEQLYVDRNRRLEFVNLMHKEDSVFNFEAQTFRKDGSITWISINARNVRDENGKTLYYEGTIENISERKNSENALRESEKRFREFADLLPQTVTEFDEKGNVTFSNRNGFETFKYTQEDFDKGVNLLQLVIPEDRDRAKESMRQLLSEGHQMRNSGTEYTVMRKDGSPFYAVVYTSPVIRENRPVGFRSIVIDITEQKKADNALRMNEARLRQVIDLVPHFIFAKDRSGRFVLANQSVADAYGTSVEGLVGKTDADFNQNSYEIEHFLRDDREVMDRGIPKEIAEEKITDSKGNIRFLSTTKIPFTLSMTGSDAILGVSIDITARKQIEGALKESVDLFRGLAEQPLVGIYLIQDNLFRYSNPAFAAMHGYQPEEMVNILGPMDTIAPEDKGKIFKYLIRRFEGESVIFEFHIMQKDGARRAVESFSRNISHNGRPAILGILIDCTERKHAEEVVKESELKFRALFDLANDAIFIMKDYTIFDCNRKTLEMFCCNRKDIIGYSPIDFSPETQPDGLLSSEKATEKINMAMEGTPQFFEWKHRRMDGSIFDAEVSLNNIELGHNEYLQVIARDVTTRKQVEEALRESEGKFRDLAEKSVAGVYLVQDGIFRYVNGKFAQILEYSINEMIEKLPVKDVIYPEDWPIVEESVRKRLSGELESLHYEFRILTKDHHMKNAEVYSSRTIYQGRAAVIGTMLDITERKLAEEEITREREKLKTLSDNAPFGMVLIDKDGHFTYINRKFSKLFGYDLPDIPDGRTWCRKAYPDGEYRHAVITAWVEDLKDNRRGGDKPNVFTVTCKDGTQKIVHFIFTALVSGDFLMTSEDITEVRQLENQLHQAQKMESIGTLAGGIAHDFNNILTVMTGYATLIKMKVDTSEPLRSYVDNVLLASQKAADLTQSLLAFSRKQSVTLGSLDINNIIRVAEKLLRRLLTENIDFRISLADDNMTVMADKSQIDQILFNLVANARDAMPKGGILAIETAIAVIDNTFIRLHGFGEAGRFVQIRISDTGLGMDAITQQKIFDPFFTTKEVGKGTGLGLATVYGIVKQNKGYITVESMPNKGATFHIYLPHITMKVDEAEEKINPVKTGNETILIAEDDEEVRSFMREALRGHGYTTREAINGDDAIHKFKQHQDIDLIVIDSVMPKKNGRETYEEIHRMDPRAKALFISGYTKDDFLEKGIKEGKFHFLAKPLLLDDFLWKVREVLDG